MRIAAPWPKIVVQTIPWVICFSCWRALPPARETAFDIQTQTVKDKIILVSAEEFKNGKVVERLVQFSKMNRNAQLARLTVGEEYDSTRAYLESPNPVDGGLVFINPSKYQQTSIYIAQAIVRGESVSIRIRKGNQVEHVSDGRIDGLCASVENLEQACLASFVIAVAHNPSVEKSKITFFFKAKALPLADKAHVLYLQLQKEHPDLQVRFVMRTDSVFNPWGGPHFDVFELPLPNIERPTYLRSEYIECWGNAKCRQTSLAGQAGNQ